MSKKSSFPPADILDVVEAATPREVAAESTAGFTWDVLEHALRQRTIGARKSRVMRCMVFGLSSGAEGLPERRADGNDFASRRALFQGGIKAFVRANIPVYGQHGRLPELKLRLLRSNTRCSKGNDQRLTLR
jgi:hypothetical protein